MEFHQKIVRRRRSFAFWKNCSPGSGEPFADSSILPTHLLCRFARETVTVALSGDGADELFGGYERYLAMRALARLDLLPETVPQTSLRFGGAPLLLRRRGPDRLRKMGDGC